MTRWDFESFVVHDANERAVRVCHAIAELHSVAVQPIVICGERGSGKTHLLCATANLARAQSARVALFGITPKYFPDKVRRLAADASQVRDVHQAILLVDDLEGITGLVHELEAVVRAFVESGQPVILCSSIHPERLRNVTPGFRAILLKGLIVSIQARTGAESKGSSRGGIVAIQPPTRSAKEAQHLIKPIEGLESENAALSDTTRRLRDELNVAQMEVARAHSETSALAQHVNALLATVDMEREHVRQLDEQRRQQSQELEVLHRQRQSNADKIPAAEGLVKQLQAELTDAVAERSRMESFLQNALVEYAAMCDRLETTPAERETMTAALGTVQKSQEGLRIRLEQALTDYAALQTQMEPLHAEAHDNADEGALEIDEETAIIPKKVQEMEARVAALELDKAALTQLTRRFNEQLLVAREDTARARREVETLTQRCGSSVQEIRSERDRFSELEREHGECSREIETLQKRQGELAAELAASSAHARQLQTEIESVSAERDEASLLLSQAQAECEAVRSAATSAREEADVLGTDLERSRADQAELTERTLQFNEQLLASREDTARAHREVEELSRRCESLAQEIWSERERFSALKREHSGCSQEIEGLQERQGELAVELAASRGRARQLETEIEGVSTERDDLKSRLDAATAQRDETSLLLSQARVECDAVRGAATSAREEADALRTDLERALTGQAALRSEMESLRLEAARDAEQARLEWAESLAAVRQQAERLKEMNKALQSEKAAVTEVVQRLRDQLETSRKQYLETREELDGIVQRTEMLLSDMATERRHFAELEEEQTKSLKEIETLRAQQRQSAADAEVATAHLQQLQEELDATLVERNEMQCRLEARLAKRDAALVAALDATRAIEKALRTQIEKARDDGAVFETPPEPVWPEYHEMPPAPAPLEAAGSLRSAQEPIALTPQEWRSTPTRRDLLKDGDEAAGRVSEDSFWSLPCLSTSSARSASETSELPSDENLRASPFGPLREKRRLGEILCADGRISPEQLNNALKEQQGAPRRKLGRILVERGYASDEVVSETVAGQLGLPFVRLHAQPISTNIVRLCSSRLAKMHRCMPVRITGEELLLAMCEPLDLVAIDDIERLTNLRVRVAVAPETDIAAAHEQYYAA